jgi:hypothetical protein
VQGLLTVAGMVGVIVCVLFGSTIGLAVAVAFDHELALSLAALGVVAPVALVALMRFQRAAEPAGPPERAGVNAGAVVLLLARSAIPDDC